VAAYGFCVAWVFVFLVYGRQDLLQSTIDLNGFGALAKSLVKGEGFSLGNGPTMRRAPLFPMLAAVALRLGGGSLDGGGMAVYAPVLFLNCLIFSLTCTVVFFTARMLFGTRTALLAALMCPLVPQCIRYVGMTEVETFMGLLLASLALVGTSLARRPTLAGSALFGAVAAAATLTKPIALLYPLAFLPLALWQWRRDGVGARRMLGFAAVLGLSFALPLVPWSLRNMSVTDGRFKGISSNGPGEFLRGYVNAQPKYYLLRQDFGGTSAQEEKWDPEANDFEEGLLATHGVPFYHCGWDSHGNQACKPPLPRDVTAAMIEVRKDEIEAAEAKQRVLHNPLGFLGKFAVQLGTFWYVVETRKKSLFVGAIALCMLLLAALGVRSAQSRGERVWPVIAVVAYMNAIYAAFLAFARYSMPVFPTLTVLSAGGLAALAARAFARWGKVEPEAIAGEKRSAS
jgi:4-amino-4-deoxy-L-arabinose transferase-like glycosyltransferase